VATKKYHFVEPLPAPYQLEALKRALKKRRFGVFFQQRVGKTRVAIDYIGFSYLFRGVRRVLIGCPKTVRPVWVEQIKEYLPKWINITIHYVGEAGTVYSNFTEHPGTTLVVYVGGYQAIVNDEKNLAKLFKPEIIIADEAHLLRGATSQRSKAMWRLAKKATDRLALTGTPIPKRPTDAFGLGRFIADIWTKVTPFRERYEIRNPYSKALLGYKNEDEISEALAPWSMRVLRKDTDIREPEVEHIVIPVELEPKARKVYNTLAQESVAELDDGSLVMAPHVLTRLMRLQQIAGGFVTREDGTIEQVSRAKLVALEDIVNTHLEADEQVIVVCRFTPEIYAIQQALAKTCLASYIDGSVSAGGRELLIGDFKAGRLPVLIGQEKAISTGIDLSAARVMVFYSVDFSLDDFNQIKDRIMGRNQKAAGVTYYYLTVKGSVDEHIYETLRNDQEISSKVADKYREILKPL
jgi:SNF2 family DNA or RNA helicase